MTPRSIRPLTAADGDACDAIIASLPYHFALEEGRREAAEAVRSQDGLVAEAGGTVVGFLTVRRHFAHSAEITWLAVHRDRRGGGVGRALVETLAAALVAEGRTLLVVLTVSATGDDEPDQPDGGYAATRAFYASAGFVEALDLPGLWGPDNLAVLLARPLTR